MAVEAPTRQDRSETKETALSVRSAMTGYLKNLAFFSSKPDFTNKILDTEPSRVFFYAVIEACNLKAEFMNEDNNPESKQAMLVKSLQILLEQAILMSLFDGGVTHILNDARNNIADMKIEDPVAPCS